MFWRNQSTNNEQLSTYYSFIRHLFQMKIVLLQVDEYFFWVSSKNRLAGEAATKRLRWKIDSPKQRITMYTLFVFRLLFVISSVFHCYSQIVGTCHGPLQNGFWEQKVYHNFVLILYNFVHRVPNFVHYSLLRYRQFKFGVAGDMQAPAPPNAVST